MAPIRISRDFYHTICRIEWLTKLPLEYKPSEMQMQKWPWPSDSISKIPGITKLMVPPGIRWIETATRNTVTAFSASVRRGQESRRRWPPKMMEKIIVKNYPHEHAMSNKTRMPEELFAELSTLATLIDCLVLRLCSQPLLRVGAFQKSFMSGFVCNACTVRGSCLSCQQNIW